MFLLTLLSALLQASSSIIDKVILSMRRVTFQMYAGASFPLIFLITLIVFFIFRPPFPLETLFGSGGVLVLAIVGLTIGNNLFFYRALQTDTLSEMQALDLLRAIPLILFASFFFPDERNWYIMSLALVSAFAVLWSHWEHHHFKIAKNSLPFLIWSLTIAPLMAPFSKILLFSWHPISLQLVRTGLTGLILWPIFAKETRSVSSKTFLLLVSANLLSTLAFILIYFSYHYLGIIYTTLLFLLHPLLVYAGAFVFLKEKFHWKKVTAFIIILLSIGAAQFFI